MKRHHALVLLCLVGFSAATTEKTIYIESGEELHLGKEEYDNDLKTISCDLILNNGTKITLDRNDYEGRFRLGGYGGCPVRIYSMTTEDSGLWKVQGTFQKSDRIYHEVYPYNVKVRKTLPNTKIYPASTAWVYPDQRVSVHFNERFDNLRSCQLLTPEGREYDLTSDKSANIKLLGHCGFRMIVKNEYHGVWTLIADLNNETAYRNTFNVIVKSPEDLNPNNISLMFKRGEEGIVTGGTDKTKLCILETPHGEKLPLTEGKCSYSIPVVAEHHEGIWKAYYGLDGIEQLLEQDIVVKTYETSQFNSSVTHSENGDINLLCRVRSRDMKFCSFVKPNGEVLHMTYAVGNEKYEYYGNGRQNEGEVDCGITIHKPTKSDYGSWRCIVKTSPSNTEGSVLKVTSLSKSESTSTAIAVANAVYVKRGESFKVKCSTDEVLSYCWFRSPNGTMHTVVDDKHVKLPYLKYEGEGLELGDCSAIVPKANDSDDGLWTCHMGIANGPELEASFNVVMRETHLIAARETIVFDSDRTFRDLDLICRPLPGSNKVIEACRWVNPIGHGINVDPQGRYLTETYTTHCKLTIRAVDFDEDMGEWSCYARFVSDKEEGHATMRLGVRILGGISFFLGAGLVVSLLICLSTGLLALVVYKRRLAARRQPDEKIILEKSPDGYP